VDESIIFKILSLADRGFEVRVCYFDFVDGYLFKVIKGDDRKDFTIFRKYYDPLVVLGELSRAAKEIDERLEV